MMTYKDNMADTRIKHRYTNEIVNSFSLYYTVNKFRRSRLIAKKVRLYCLLPPADLNNNKPLLLKGFS